MNFNAFSQRLPTMTNQSTDNLTNDLQSAQTLFASEGLTLPFIPEPLKPDFKVLADWVYGTRDDSPPLYNIRHFVQEAESAVADYVLVGHDGHGVNSYAMHYYLVYGPIALFVQMSWGGAYTDNEKAAQRIVNVFKQAEEVVATAVALQSSGKLGTNDRITVILSNLYDQDRWRHSGAEDASWHNTYTALRDVQAYLDSFT